MNTHPLFDHTPWRAGISTLTFQDISPSEKRDMNTFQLMFALHTASLTTNQAIADMMSSELAKD